MDNIEIKEIETPNGLEVYVIIDRGNNEFSSMTKTHWDELEAQREQSETL